jgi:hypothetical protein
MTIQGALVVIVAVLVGMLVASQNGLDGAQTFATVCFAWICLSACYHAVGAVLGAFRVKRRRGR